MRDSQDRANRRKLLCVTVFELALLVASQLHVSRQWPIGHPSGIGTPRDFSLRRLGLFAERAIYLVPFILP